MELRQFITRTLLDIIGAVKDAQLSVPKGCIVPNVKKTFDAVQHGVSQIQAIEFEVSVRADEHVGTEGKLNVVTAIIGGGVRGEKTNSGGHAATLKFRIPIELPGGEESPAAVPPKDP